MPRKGTPNPNAGRPPGSPNKATLEFKEALTKLMDTAAPDLIKWLEEIDDPFKRFEVLSKFAEFIYPKLGRTEMQALDKNGNKADAKLSLDDLAILDHYISQRNSSNTVGGKDDREPSR